MIKSFKDKETERVYQRLFSKQFPQEIQRTALRKLRMLNNARALQDLRSPPGNRLERLKGDRAGQHSIRINGLCLGSSVNKAMPPEVRAPNYRNDEALPINDQWRICFVWRADDAFEVEITDYH